MKKVASLAIILGLLLLGSMLLSRAQIVPPSVPPYPPYSSLIAAQDNPPVTVDPAAAYDKASGQLIQQVYDTLISFDGEHTDSYIPDLATSWTVQNVIVSGAPGTPNNPYNVAYYNRPSYYRYTFQITPNAWWQIPDFPAGQVTTADVAYSFKRVMIEDYAGGPAWMLDEPLLGNAIGPTAWNIGNTANPGPDAALVGRMINDSVQYTSTAVWLNIAYGVNPGGPGSPYLPMLGILCQTCSSILCWNWIKTFVIGALNQPDWYGTFGADYKGWLAAHFATPPPTSLDFPGTPAGALMMGSGPYRLTKLDYTAKYWTVDRDPGYWGGWPAPFPTLSAVKPAGYVDEFTVTWNFDWATRLAMFKSGDVDFIDVPRQYIPQMYKSSAPNYPWDGIRCIWPLPSLSVNALFYNFAISPTSPYGQILPAGTFAETGVPSDFFGNPTWGIHVRKAFSYALDYDKLITDVYGGEATHPSTAIIPGLVGYDPTVNGYTFNPTAATEEFKKVPGLWETGFTITLVYNTGAPVRQRCVELLQESIQSLNPKFHANIAILSGYQYGVAMNQRQLPTFVRTWLADYPDAHDFALPFYGSNGELSAPQGYSNSAMDALINAGIAESVATKRAIIYGQIEALAIDDCPSVSLAQPFERHFERDLVVGWYYNPMYPGIYAYNLWKWYYIPQAFSSPVVQPQSNQLPCDNSYKCSISLLEIFIVAKAFGTMPGDKNWNFRADVDNTRKVALRDIFIVARYFGQRSLIWAPGLYVTISPLGTVMNVTPPNPTTPVTLTSMVPEPGGVPPYTYVWYQNDNITATAWVQISTLSSYTYLTTAFPTLAKGDTWTELFCVVVTDAIGSTNSIIAYVTLVT